MAEPESRTNSRAALLEAAFEEFTTKGYEAATVAGIADRAGVTTGALYAHFGGKLDLLLATVDLTPIADVARSLDGATAAAVPAALARSLAEHPDARRVLLLDVIVAARRDPHVAEVLRGGLEAYVRATGRALGAGDGVARLLAVLNLGMVVFAALDARIPPPAEFGRVLSALLPPEPPDGDDAPIDRVRVLAAEAAQAEARLRDGIVAAIADGHSLRQVGTAAGRSHEAVRKIVRAASDLDR